jgi:hypothetical protein
VRSEHARRSIDVFLTYLFPKQVDVSAIREIQRIGIPCVNFFCDSVREFRRVPAEFRPFALHWVPEFEALPLYRTAGLPHIHAPMPCWIPPEYRSVPDRESEPPTFVGSADVLRCDLLARVLSCGENVIVRGPDWRPEPGWHEDHAINKSAKPQSIATTMMNQYRLIRDHGLKALFYKLQQRLHPLRPSSLPESAIRTSWLSDKEYFRVSREASILIGINRVPTLKATHRRPLVYSRLRDIEAPMLGACYLTEWSAGLASLYELGTEIETYRTADELADKIGLLNRNLQQRRVMRHKAQRHALDEHSVGRSVARMARSLGIVTRP